MQTARSLPLVAFCLACLVSQSAAEELSGRVVVTKQMTRKRVTLPVYQLRGVSSAVPPNDSAPINEYENIVVFIEGNPSKTNKAIQAELQQRNQRFEPQLLVVPVGSTVSFPNTDPIFHNVFSLSGAKKFDLGYYPAGQTRLVTFNESGVVQVYCHLHPNMYAAIVVVPNQWYARPAEDGTFSLGDIPPGKYDVVAWHMTAGLFRTSVSVAAGRGAHLVLNIPVHDDAGRH